MVALLDAAGLHGIKTSLETNESFLSTVSASPLEEATCVQSMLAQEELRKEPGKGSLRSSTVELLSFSGEHAEAMFFLTRHLITSMEKVDKAGSWAKASTLPWIIARLICSDVLQAAQSRACSSPSLKRPARLVLRTDRPTSL